MLVVLPPTTELWRESKQSLFMLTTFISCSKGCIHTCSIQFSASIQRHSSAQHWISSAGHPRFPSNLAGLRHVIHFSNELEGRGRKVWSGRSKPTIHTAPCMCSHRSSHHAPRNQEHSNRVYHRKVNPKSNDCKMTGYKRGLTVSLAEQWPRDLLYSHQLVSFGLEASSCLLHY